MRSSSIHSLNADTGLSQWKRRLWYFLNWINNSIFPNWKSNRLAVRKFVPDLKAEFWEQTAPKSSPSRALSDLFWMQLPWQRIHSTLGEIRILDTGCGSGRYGIELQQYSRDRIAAYTGLDEYPHEDWSVVMKEHPFITLRQADSAQFESLIPSDANLFVSQSAIEHFPEDLVYFSQLQDFIRGHQRPTLQIHLFPSAACLKLYRYHGVRQYTPRTVSMIANLFADSRCNLFVLGGESCNRLHSDYITKPVLVDRRDDRRNSETGEYRIDLMKAINSDAIANNNENNASFYALVIETKIEPCLLS